MFFAPNTDIKDESQLALPKCMKNDILGIQKILWCHAPLKVSRLHWRLG